MSGKVDLAKGRDALAKRYREHGDPRRERPGDRPTSEQAHNHAAKVARDIERQQADKK